MVSREGRSLYLPSISPVSPLAILTSKVVVVAVPVAALLAAPLRVVGTRLLRLPA
jgi:hypothetical protein